MKSTFAGLLLTLFKARCEVDLVFEFIFMAGSRK
jgi:hypothetical protein